jgi:hypothetical protein
LWTQDGQAQVLEQTERNPRLWEWTGLTFHPDRVEYIADAQGQWRERSDQAERDVLSRTRRLDSSPRARSRALLGTRERRLRPTLHRAARFRSKVRFRRGGMRSRGNRSQSRTRSAPSAEKLTDPCHFG